MFKFKETEPHTLVDRLVEGSKTRLQDIGKFVEGDENYDFLAHLNNYGSLENIFELRRSEKYYSDYPVKIDDINTILYNNILYNNSSWGNSNLIDQYVIFKNVDHDAINLKKIYKYSNEDLELVEAGHINEKIVEKMYIQKEFIDSPATILLVGSLEDSLEQYNEFSGYKNLLMQAGSILHYTWIQSIAMGYSGTVFAGTLPKTLAQIVPVDGYRKMQLFAFSFGYSKFETDFEGR